jgi:hypothetical protein
MSKKNKRYIRRQQPRVPWAVIAVAAGVMLLGLTAWFLVRDRGRAAAIEVTGQPSLRVDNEEIDLGDVRLGQTVQASFELTNVGDQQLRFEEPPYVEVVEGC